MGDKKYEVIPTKTFIKELAKLSYVNKKQVTRAIDVLKVDPFYPSLRTKKIIIRGQPDLYESSVNMDIRFLWQFDEGKIIILTDVGHHDVLKKY